ncbi:MAG: hypothetical protein HeimC3_01280 [Candidatus Heimdallarchaeota archaeon LC_3]|nr:MAG: hypothetical protein HeimC3_01280 [Candidatus Heimdallarchaeota archaeon LC_3]
MISTYTLNHFGIVAGLCNELQITDKIDLLIPHDKQQKVTTGQVVVAMIINGLGFSNRRLYLFPQFLENKPIKLLIGKNLSAEDFNDDTLGRALDKIYNYGCTELFCHIAYLATSISQAEKKFGHLDTTTFSFSGDYKSIMSEEEAVAVHITHGHSKQKRFDLKQIFLNLLVCSDGGIPIFMQVLDGNSNDTVTFRKTVTDFRRGLKENLQEITYWIADSSFYCKDTLEETKDEMLWISRVPEKISEAKELIRSIASQLVNKIGKDKQLEKSLNRQGYSYDQHFSNYAGVKQRWLVIYSKPAQSRSEHTVLKAVKKEYDKLIQVSKKLQKEGFSSEEAAKKSLEKLQKKTKYHKYRLEQVRQTSKYINRGRPSKNKNSEKIIVYNVDYTIIKEQNSIDREIIKRAVFIVATNELSSDALTDQELFDRYKGQQHVERGFRFLKDPLFFASSMFLKKPERIIALTMIMCFSLLVYTIGERKLRKALILSNETINNQVRKPSQRPTLRWIFQLFEDVHLVKIEKKGKTHFEVKNLRSGGIKALEMLGREYLDKYLMN